MSTTYVAAMIVGGVLALALVCTGGYIYLASMPNVNPNVLTFLSLTVTSVVSGLIGFLGQRLLPSPAAEKPNI